MGGPSSRVTLLSAARFLQIMIACEQALLFGQAKRASRERESEGPNRRACSQAKITFTPFGWYKCFDEGSSYCGYEKMHAAYLSVQQRG